MNQTRLPAVIWNSGGGAWMFQELAEQLSQAWGVPVSEEPGAFNYLLNCEQSQPCDALAPDRLFIPWKAMTIASDKRLQAEAFWRGRVPIPETHILPDFQDCLKILRERWDKEWCLKFPTGCGAAGHRFLQPGMVEPKNWPKNYVLQEFIRLKVPEVYRTYVAGGELFGWVVRRFPSTGASSPWVAHARGARYECLFQAIPLGAREAARLGLQATGLWDSFGCVDLLQRPNDGYTQVEGEWLVLEVGTDGLYNHVDREIGDRVLEQEILERVKVAFLKAARIEA